MCQIVGNMNRHAKQSGQSLKWISLLKVDFRSKSKFTHSSVFHSHTVLALVKYIDN